MERQATTGTRRDESPPLGDDTGTARVPLDKDGPFERALGTVSRTMFGRVIDPMKVAFHHRPILLSYLGFELSAKTWTALPENLQALAVMASAQEIGCTWCLDFGYWENVNKGVDPAKLRAVAQWRTATVFTPIERAVIEYSVAATQTPPEVTDEMVDALRTRLDDRQIVELTSLVALENYRSRINASMGLTGQGFSAECAVPLSTTPAATGGGDDD